MRRTSTHRPRNRRRPARNRRRFSIKRLVWLFVVLLLMAGIGTGCYFVLTTPKLIVANVKVLGTKLLDNKAVEADARSAACGKNILLISKEDITSQVKKNRPEIQKINVGRVLPRTVVIKIEERQPYAAVMKETIVKIDAIKPVYWLVDNNGIPFHQVKKLPESLPLIVLPAQTKADFIGGKKVKNSSFENAMDCIKECKKNSCKVNKISVDPVGNLCLNIGSDFYVKLGQPVEITKKLVVLSRILSRPEVTEKSEYIDVSCSEAPVWKPKEKIIEQPIDNETEFLPD